MFPEVHTHLPAVREALFAGKYKEADRLVTKIQGQFSQSFAPLGELIIDWNHSEDVTNYRRELDLTTATATVSYQTEGVNYKRSTFVSHPNQAIFLRFTADKEKALSFSLSAVSLLRSETNTTEEQLILSGRAPVHAEPNYRQHIKDPIIYDDKRGTRFRAVTKILSTDGTVTANSGTLSVSDATEAVVAVVISTSFDRYDRAPDLDEVAISEEILKGLSDKDWDTLYAAHLKDYQRLYDRVELHLGETPKEQSSKPTDARLKAYSDGASDNDLEALYFQYGRYLLICSSRTPGVPANLQGIWNPYMRPPWSCNYTANINVEMNYWPAEVCNLSELHEPLLSFIENLADTGSSTAQRFFGCEGWTCCHNTDIWALSNPVGDFGNGHPVWANWCLGGAWFSTHLWERYTFTQDRVFLKDRAYPIIKGATKFCLSWLVEGEGGELITAPSTSPENLYQTPSGYVGATAIMTTSDLSMIRELFKIYLSASELLQEDAELRKQVQTAMRCLPPYGIGSKGQLLEWRQDWEDAHPQHRHVSHLFGVYPGHQITPNNDPALAAAVRRSLDLRGDGGTGWSKAWKINLWARLRDGDRAHRLLRAHLNYVEPTKDTDYNYAGGTFPNLWDCHPPYQIDGNFGGTSGIAEMLIQSTPDSITLLPALPSAWPKGHVRGLCARGGFEVEIDWIEGELVNASILSKNGGKTTIHYGSETMELDMKKGERKNLQLTAHAQRPLKPRNRSFKIVQ